MQYVDETDIQKFKKVNTSSWDDVKDNVFLRLINKKYLSKYGEGIAYANFMDLVMVFSVQEKVNDTIISHILTEKELEALKVDTDKVKQVALHNTGNDRKRRIMTFKESILSTNPMHPVMQIPQGMMMGAGGSSSSDCGIIQDTDEDRDNILILCSKNEAFGSSYMAVPEILDEVYMRFGMENFYIIPMSIHQIMCVRSGYASHDGKKPCYEVEDDLLGMIEFINDNKNKSWKDILSYKIYYYFGDDGKTIYPIK